MTVFEELQTPEVKELRKRHHELYGYWEGYHWEEFGSIEAFKAYLREEISKAEKELEESQDNKNHP